MSEGQITYNPTDAHNVLVLIDGQKAGAIRKVPAGFQYFPKGRKVGGKIFGSVSAVQRSLEGDD